MFAMPKPPGCVGGGGGSRTLGVGNENFQSAYSICRGSTAYSARVPLTIGDRDLANVNVVLTKAVSISGTIVYADGPAAADTPMARIALSVFAEPANGDVSLGMPTGRSVTGETVRFKVDGLLPGAYLLRPSASSLRSIEWQGRDYLDRAFDTTAGRDIEGVVITVANSFTRVRGSVRDAKGATATGGAVIAFPVDQRLWVDYGLRATRMQRGQIATGGAFSIGALPAGDYYIVALDAPPPPGWISPAFLTAAAPVASRMTLTWGESKTVDLMTTTVRVAR